MLCSRSWQARQKDSAMSLSLTVHRGTQQIGGSCIELVASNGDRLILDAGRPLDAPRGASGLLPTTLDVAAPATVVFSHPHMDHWGLIEELPAAWPIWTGAKSAELMRLTSALFGGEMTRPISTWHSRSSGFRVGSFHIQPFLTDHSALDAYMLLIEADSRRILYTGDFRGHGRKAVLLERMMAAPPQDVDVLLMEGTNLRSTKPTITETELEWSFTQLARTTPGHIFVDWSAQNIDRTVTLYRAAKRSGRDLILDLYATDVLQRIAAGTRIPRPGPRFPLLKTIITPGGKSLFRRQGRDDFVNRSVKGGSATSRRRLAGGSAFIMLRNSMVRDFERGGLGFTSRDAYVFSNWSGYLDTEDPNTAWARAKAAGAAVLKLHTSGHASPETLSNFARVIAPKALVPVHGVAWDAPEISLPPVVRLRDGQRWVVAQDR